MLFPLGCRNHDGQLVGREAAVGSQDGSSDVRSRRADQEQGWIALLVWLGEASEGDTLGLVVSDALVHTTRLLGGGEAIMTQS